jgi:hypothetical protein
MLPGMKRHQRGLGAFGSVVVIAIFVAAGYYAYKYAMEPDTVSAPSCREQLNRCTANCRKTNTEAPGVQACQETCKQNAAACEEKKR